MEVVEISLYLQSIEQLLAKPSPFHQKDALNKEAEEYFIRAAESVPRRSAIKIKINLPEEASGVTEVSSAIRKHFTYRKEIAKKKLKRCFQLGWSALFVSFVFLAFLYLLIELSGDSVPKGGLAGVLRESLIILGWVALWRPADLLLYEWRPYKRECRMFEKLENSNVQLTHITNSNRKFEL